MDATISFENGSWAVFITGEIDIASVEELRGIGEAAALLPPRCIDVDLRGVTFIDASGLGALIAVRRQMISAGSRMIVLRPSPAVVRMFELTRTRGLLTGRQPHRVVRPGRAGRVVGLCTE